MFSLLLSLTLLVGATNLANQLVQLRAEVDGLQSQIQMERIGLTKEMASLSVQKGDLKASIDKETLRIREVEKSIASYQKQLRVHSGHNEELKPLIQMGLDNLLSYIDQSMPFQSNHRKTAVEKLSHQFKASTVPMAQALSRLWSQYEDEFRLAQDSGLHRQVLSIDGSDELVDVIHLGMFAMYFHTTDGRLGVIHRTQNQWETTFITESNLRRETKSLFESFEKKVRVGRFDLPSPFGGNQL